MKPRREDFNNRKTWKEARNKHRRSCLRMPPCARGRKSRSKQPQPEETT